MIRSRARSRWNRRESLTSALVQIALVAALLAAGVHALYRRGAARRELSELMHRARDTALKGNRADLRAAAALVDQALALDGDSADANAFGAAVWLDLLQDHREPGAQAKAEAFLTRAQRAGARSDDRFGAEAELELLRGNPEGAVHLVSDLRSRGGSGARLFLAEARALKAEGNLPLARAAFAAAMDKGYRDVRYTCAAGEALLEEGAPGALDLLARAVAERPGSVRARLGLALGRLLKGERLEEVAAIVQELTDERADLSGPQRARALALSAGLLEVQGRYAEALSAASLALSLEPKELWAMLFRARAMAATDAVGAADAFNALVDAAPASPLFYFEGAARLLRAKREPAGMELLGRYEAFFKAAKALSPDGREVPYLDRDDRYWLARGELLRAAGRLDEALEAFQRASDARGPMLARAQYAQASLLLSRAQREPAEALLQGLTPADGTGLAEAYLARADLQFAKREWGPGCQNFAFALTRLRETHAPATRRTEVYQDVERRLASAGQHELARLWSEEAKALAH